MEYLIGALCAWWLISFVETETHILCGLIDFPMIVTHVALEIILFPFVLFYRVFLRHTINPVTQEQVNKAKIMEDSKHLFDDLYVCFDKNAKKLCNKVFLFRIKHIEYSNTPSSPEGEFRIGEE